MTKLGFWEYGPRISIEDLPEAEAIAIFGRPVYEAWKATKISKKPRGSLRVSAIDTEARTVTLQWQDEP